ncbi:putative ribonuclease H-like domain-containing protein [Tanacetum coccineum]
MDDLYNNIKVYESEIKGQSSSNSNSQNVAFVSFDNSSSTNEIVNTAHSVSTASSKDQASTVSYADDVMFSFFANQSNAPQLDNEDLEQIDADDLEEMDLKWQVAMLTMRVKRFINKTGRKLDLNSKEIVGFGRTKVECYNCHRRGYFAKECRALKNQGNRNRDDPRRNAPVKTSTTNALVVQDRIGCYDWSFQAEEGITNFALMAYTSQGSSSSSSSDSDYDVQVKDISIKDLRNLLEEALKEKDDLKLKLEKFEESSKNPTKLINSQITDKDKSGLGFVKNFPLPYTGNYMPSIPDLSFDGLDDFVYKTKVSETETSISKTSKDIVEKPKTVRPNAPIIEEWDTDSDNDKNTHRKVEYPRKSQSPRGNRRNWNGMITQKLRNGFEFIKKACFVCRSFNHLIKDCDFHDNKMVEKPVLNNKGRVTGQREIRPVWNNAQRVNHQNKLTHPHPKRNFVPTAVATKSGQVLVNAAKQSSPKAATSISTPRPVNTAAPKSKVNDALPITYSYFKPHSPVRGVNNITTGGTKAVGSAAVENGENDVKSSTFWIWRPTGNVIDHNSKDSGSYMLKRFDYGNPQYTLQDQGIFDSGCSRHMTGNKSFLTDYQEIDGGFVAFAGSAKGGKITGKGKIRTEKLDFEDVYFVKELKFNLFSVSQMCDKKNSVLFTDTECVVLSPDFKLLDESQVLLKVPRNNNMYSFDLKNVVPLGGLTCLFAKATLDESNLWHRRLGHINFKTMNKLVRGNLVRGLPSKLFENDQTCVACQKGKQHKASCKTKTVSSICKPLQLLHMDLFGPVSMKSINKKSYCLVVTDDFSRFSWVFFLATKDETPEILKNFITGIENQTDHKVKTIRCDNGTEFKNRIMNEFYEMKGIRREFSVARTPQQNGVAKRKNRTLIEAARTMLADSKLPTTFWAEAVNTACYVQNRVLVIKPHNKTPYELFLGRKSALKFMRPFGCPVIILNTLDHLGNQTNGNAGTKENIDEGQRGIKTVPGPQYVLLPFLTSDSQSLKSSEDEVADDAGKKNGVLDPAKEDDKSGQGEATNTNSTNRLNTISSLINIVSSSFTTMDPGRERAPRNEFESVGALGCMKMWVAEMDVKSAFLYGTIEEEVYVYQPPGFEDPQFPDKVYKVYVDDIIFGSTKKSLCTEFESLMHKKFQMSSMGELTFFLGLQVIQRDDGIFISQDKYVVDILKKFYLVIVKTTSTLIETNKALLKDEEAEDVDVHLYRSMIRSLMYLTTSRPDIIFAVCACARFQVTPKVSHLHVVKRIFRYLKGQPKLGLWYPRDSPFNLEAFSDSDYARASLDRKSTTGDPKPDA